MERHNERNLEKMPRDRELKNSVWDIVFKIMESDYTYFTVELEDVDDAEFRKCLIFYQEACKENRRLIMTKIDKKKKAIDFIKINRPL